MFWSDKSYILLRNDYTLLLFAREKGVKICVFENKILILHSIFALFVLKRRIKT